MSAKLPLELLRATNTSRASRWHPGGIADWTPERWYTALIGEAGEAGNALKKLFRVEDGIANKSEPGREILSRSEAIVKIAEELADTLIYLDLFAQSLGIDLAAATIAKFNSVSHKYGFPERLPDEMGNIL